MKNVLKKNSLATLVTAGFAIIIVVTLISTMLNYSRLKTFSNILSDITEHSLLETAKAGELNNTLKEILYLTERLANANNLASRRIAIDKMLEQELSLLHIIETFEDAIHLNNQIRTVRMEISQLDQLVVQKITNARKLQLLNEEIYSTHDNIVEQLNQFAPSDAADKSLMLLIQNANLTHKAQNAGKLQPVRQLAKDVDINLNAILQNTLLLNPKQNPSLIADIKTLEDLLLSKDGWFTLQVEQLQISGRVRGRGNFLHNLIVDITRLSETRFYKINESIVAKAHASASQMSQQIIWVFGLAIALFLLMSATIYFINTRVVARLLKLNESVIKRMKSKDAPIDASGNDEISHLAQSFIYFSEKVEEQKQQLQLLSLTDVLTNLPNRRAMDERLEHDIHTAKRNKWSLSIIILDVDYFKAYNDHYGHLAGDVCLKSVALGLKSLQQRDSDFIARYGGEEFVMLLPNTDKGGAINVAIRIKEMLEVLNLPHEENKVTDHVSASMGVATFNSDSVTTADKMLNLTDKALYTAKSAGRNTFIHADDI